MEAQINDTGSHLSDADDVSILQTEDGNASDIRINYSSDVSNVGMIIYDQNLHNDGDNQANPPWKKDLSTFLYLLIIIHIYIAYYSHCALMRFFKKTVILLLNTHRSYTEKNKDCYGISPLDILL